jgi:hypothetical protein
MLSCQDNWWNARRNPGKCQGVQETQEMTHKTQETYRKSAKIFRQANQVKMLTMLTCHLREGLRKPSEVLGNKGNDPGNPQEISQTFRQEIHVKLKPMLSTKNPGK